MPNQVTYKDGKTPAICIVGAGFSGLCAAIRLKTELGLKTFTIYEENSDVGGTWYSNTYPGCACDVPSHLYSFSFELNPNWSENFSSQAEILDYLKKVTQKYELYPQIKFETHVKNTVWIESIKKWKVTVIDKKSNFHDEQLFDIVIMGPGALRLPNIPKQFESFKGPSCHSALWDHSIELDNKRVGIIGSGTSAIQIIPSIAPRVKELHIYQRRPAWVIPRQQFEFSNFVKTMFARVPFLMLFYRTYIYLLNELRYYGFKANSYLGKWATNASLKQLEKNIRDEELRKAVTPQFAFGCKRLMLTSDYYPALCLPQVKVHNGQIGKVNDYSITMENGITQDLDVLILATGFRVQDYFHPMEIIGKNSENIMEKWKASAPKMFYGIVSSDAPNQFILLGPNTALGHNTVVFMIECQVNFTISVIREMMARDAKYMSVNERAEDEYMKYMEQEMSKTVWGTEKCGSWYANKAGIITALWPKDCTSYWWETKNIDFSKFIFEQ